MTRTIRILLALTTLFAAVSFGFPFNKQKFLDWANKYAPQDTFHDNWGEYKPDKRNRECGHFVMRAIAEAAPELALFMKWKGRYNPKCNVGVRRYNDGLPTLGQAIPWLRDHAGWNVTGLQFTRTEGDPPPGLLNQIRLWLEPGDIVGLIPWIGSVGHAGIIYDTQGNDDFGWRDHNGPGGTWPWYSDSTGYACLSWSQSNGTTWDTLISPRINLAGDSAVLLRQDSYSNLLHGSNKTIEVRGSTDNGTTWPYLIGSDSLTVASLPWATNQRNVRIAWIYKGPVQAGRYWCIDDVELWAKPSRSRDVSVSGIARPCGIMTQGKVVVPAAFVWNHGKQTESISVRMTIGGGYTNTRWVKLYPYNDTLLEFATWNASPGTYTAICYTSLDSDECRGNDTATLTFRVVADTWVRMFPVYGGGLMPGACLATTDSNTIFCANSRPAGPG